MENKLIEVAKAYLTIDIADPASELLNIQLFNIAKQVKYPQTKAGKAIVAYVKSEEYTEYSMSAGDEFEAMELAIAETFQEKE